MASSPEPYVFPLEAALLSHCSPSSSLRLQPRPSQYNWPRAARREGEERGRGEEGKRRRGGGEERGRVEERGRQ